MFSLYTHQCKQPFINKIFWRDHHVTTVNQCDCCIKALKSKETFFTFLTRVSDPDPHGSALIWVAGSGSAFKLRIRQVQVKLFSLPPSSLRKTMGPLHLKSSHTHSIFPAVVIIIRLWSAALSRIDIRWKKCTLARHTAAVFNLENVLFYFIGFR